MGKHNGKARPSGAKVGSALVNNARKVEHIDTAAYAGARSWMTSCVRVCDLDLLTSCALCQGGKGGKIGAIDEFRHTTDPQGAPNMQSVIENNDLTELLTMVHAVLAALTTVLRICVSAPFCDLHYSHDQALGISLHVHNISSCIHHVLGSPSGRFGWERFYS